MTQVNNKLFIPTTKGVNIIVYGDAEKKRFVSNDWYTDERLNKMLGLDKPKNRVKAICK